MSDQYVNKPADGGEETSDDSPTKVQDLAKAGRDDFDLDEVME